MWKHCMSTHEAYVQHMHAVDSLCFFSSPAMLHLRQARAMRWERVAGQHCMKLLATDGAPQCK